MPAFQQAPSAQPHPPHVLLVEASDDNREMYAFFLKHVGFTVTEAASAQDALRALASHPPDLVVTDLALPGIGGLDFCREIRHHAAWDRTPVIALSMTPLSEPELERALEAGSDIVLPMPCLPDTLLFQIRKALQRCETPRERARSKTTSTRFERCQQLLAMLSQEDLMERIKATYRERPSLSVRLDEAPRIFDSDRVACRLALRGLVDAGWLEETPQQTYVRGPRAE